MSEVKTPELLTASEWLLLMGRSAEELLAELRERGLIAPEPVPVDALAEAVRASMSYLIDFDDCDLRDVVQGLRDRGVTVAERKELTREMVEKAHIKTYGYAVSPVSISAFHTSLLQQMNGGGNG